MCKRIFCYFSMLNFICFYIRLTVRENGKQKVCIAGLMETEVKSFNNLTHVSLHKLVPCSVQFLQMLYFVVSSIVETGY